MFMKIYYEMEMRVEFFFSGKCRKPELFLPTISPIIFCAVQVQSWVRSSVEIEEPLMIKIFVSIKYWILLGLNCVHFIFRRIFLSLCNLAMWKSIFQAFIFHRSNIWAFRMQQRKCAYNICFYFSFLFTSLEISSWNMYYT